MSIHIRRAEPGDGSLVAPLFDAYRVFYQQASDIEGALQFITDRLLQNESVIFIAYLNDAPVGFTQLFPIFTSVGMQRTWLLNDLYVTEHVRCKALQELCLMLQNHLAGAQTANG